jgi:hypothetical protein
MKTLATGVIVLALSAGAATAETWWHLGRARDIEIAVERDSVRSDGALRTAWFATAHQATNHDMGFPYDYQLTLERFDCDRQTVEFLRTVYYRTDGEPISVAGTGTVNTVAPGTVAGGKLAAVCRGVEGGRAVAGPREMVAAMRAN